MSISFVESAAAFGTTGVTVNPVGTSAAGDINVLTVGCKPYNAVVDTPSGWIRIGSGTNGSVTSGVDVGSVQVVRFVKFDAISTTPVVVTTSGTSSNVMAGNVSTFRKAASEGWDYTTQVFAPDTTQGVDFSGTATSNMMLLSGDYLLVNAVANSDAGSGSGRVMSTTGLSTIGSYNGMHNSGSANGDDIFHIAGYHAVTGTQDDNNLLTFVYTNANTASGLAGILRLRAYVSYGAFYEVPPISATRLPAVETSFFPLTQGPRAVFNAAGTVLTSTATSNVVAAPAGQQDGDINFLFVAVKSYSVVVNTPAGWVKVAERTSGSTASGVGTGDVGVLLFTNEGITGSATVTCTTPTIFQAVMVGYHKKYASDSWLAAVTTGVDATSGADYSATADDKLSAMGEDTLLAFTASNNNVASPSSRHLSSTGNTLSVGNIRVSSPTSTGDDGAVYVYDVFSQAGLQTDYMDFTFNTATTNLGATVWVRLASPPGEEPASIEAEQTGKTIDAAEDFPNVIVEWAPEGDYSEKTYACTGFTDITQFVASVSGTLRGREYEIGSPETGSLSISLDNDDGRFTPGSRRSPYAPNVKANRRLRIRGKNMLPIQLATGGGKDHNTLGFRTAAGLFASISQATISIGTHDEMLLPSGIGPYHIEAGLKNNALAGVHDVVEWFVPVELGQRLTHSAYVWRVAGIEPFGATEQMVITYYDKDDNPIQPTDLAEGRPVTGSGSPCTGTQTADKAVNGTWNLGVDDKWCTVGAANLVVDLGSVRDISGFSLYHAGAGGEAENLNTRNFTIQISNDDSTYETVVTQVANSASINRFLQACSGRYVKLDITDAGADGTVRIYEFTVSGTDGVIDQRSSVATWEATPAVPLRVALSDQAPWNARYAQISLRVTLSSKMDTGDLRYAITGLQTEVPTNNYAPLTDASNYTILRGAAETDKTILNVDTSFEAGTNPWFASNGTTLTRYFGNAASGQWSLQIVPDGVTASPGARSELLPVVGGRTYYVAGKFWAATALNCRLGVTWYMADGVTSLHGSTNVSQNVAGREGEWEEQTFYAPPEAGYARLWTRTGGVSTTWYIDDVTFKTNAVNEGATVDQGFAPRGIEVVFASGDAGASVNIPRLTPGDTYTAVCTVKKAGAPDMVMTTDDGGTGANIYEALSQTVYLTFVATKVSQRLLFKAKLNSDVIPLAAVLGIRNLVVVPGTLVPDANYVLPSVGWSAASLEDNGVTDWELPKPIFEGWTSDLPAEVMEHTSMVSVSVDDRLSRLGNVSLSSNLTEMYFRDDVDMLIPMTDSALTTDNKLSLLGNWGEKSGITSVLLTKMTTAIMSNASYALGIEGPQSPDTAIQFNRKTSPTQDGTGYCVPIPYSKDYAVPTPATSGREYSQVYYATWSHSYNGSNVRRSDDNSSIIYQGNCCGSDNKGLIGFNINAMWADTFGATITSVWFHIYARHWWYAWGGYPTIGWHTYGEDDGPYTWSQSRANLDSYTPSVYSPRGAWLSFSIWDEAVPLFTRGQSGRGMSVGPSYTTDKKHYGYYDGAGSSNKPYITVTYVK